jgi:hypothetical protein
VTYEDTPKASGWISAVEKLLSASDAGTLDTSPDREQLVALAQDSGGVVDYQTLQRALRPFSRPNLDHGATRRFDLVTDTKGVPSARILCLDVDAMGGVEHVVHWLQSNGAALASRVIVAAVGTSSADVSALVGLVRVIISRPEGKAAPPWTDAIYAVSNMLKGGDAVKPDARGLDGGVSLAEFEESVARAAEVED